MAMFRAVLSYILAFLATAGLRLYLLMRKEWRSLTWHREGPALLVALFTTIERGQTPQDIAKNDVLMRCVSDRLI